MRVEYSKENTKKAPKRTKKKTRKTGAVVLLVSIILFVTVFASLSLTVLFNIKNITVTGESQYTMEQVISASGVTVGANLVSLPTEKCENNIKKLLPYIAEVEINRVFPDSVSINVSPAREFAAVKIDDKYLKVDEHFKVLSVEENKPEDLLLIRYIEAESVPIGNEIVFSDEGQKESLKKIIDITTDLQMKISHVDVKSLVDLNFCIDKKIYVKVGSTNYLDEKMLHLSAALKSTEPIEKGVVSLVDWSENNKKVWNIDEDIAKYIE